MSVRDILLQHTAEKVQGVLLAQLAAYAVNDDMEIIVKIPGEGISRASVLAVLLSLPLMRQPSM